MFTFEDLQDEVKRRSTRNESGTTFDTAVKNVINTSLFRLSNEALWKTLRRATSFTTTASTEEFVLAPQISDRFFMWHEKNGYPFVMNYIPEQKFLGLGLTRTDSGTPNSYRMWTNDMVKTQPTAASVISISSSAAADTSIECTVFGIVSGYPDYEVITTDAADGTTASAGSKSFTSVDRFVKSATSTGRITATSNAAAVTVAVIPVGDITAGIIYKKVKIYPVASAAFTMNVYYYKEPYRLVNNGDVHELGQNFDEALILLATAKLNYQQNKDEGDKFFGLYKDEIKVLKKTNIDKIDWFPNLQRANQSRNSIISYANFGANFGPSSSAGIY